MFTELEGTWKSSCLNFSDAGYFLDTWTFACANFTDTEASYTDATCSALSFTALASGSFSLPGAASSPAGAKKLNLVPTSLKITPATAQAASSYNAIHYCGITTWAANQTQDVTSKTCAGFTVYGGPVSTAPIFTIYTLNATSWKLGACVMGSATDCSSDANRPTTLNAWTYAKQ
jgi:hypothetical protein